MDITRLKDRLRRHEGLRLAPYHDTEGHLTIGYGRNLDAVGIDRDEAELMLSHDVHRAVEHCVEEIPWCVNLDDVRQEILIEMAFNLGVDGLLGFERMLAALHLGRFDDAAVEMTDSLWFHQVGQRAVELISAMRRGRWE